jgi:hypothetical protein
MHRVHDNPRARSSLLPHQYHRGGSAERERERARPSTPPCTQLAPDDRRARPSTCARPRPTLRAIRRARCLSARSLYPVTILLGFGGNRSIACARPRSSSNLLRPNKKTCTHAHHPWSDARSGQVTAGEIPANSACSSTLERARQHARPVHVRVRASARHSAPPQPLPGRLRTPVLPIRPS